MAMEIPAEAQGSRYPRKQHGDRNVADVADMADLTWDLAPNNFTVNHKIPLACRFFLLACPQEMVPIKDKPSECITVGRAYVVE
jgi:hypothetical protein